MTCIWIYNPRLTVDEVARETTNARIGVETRAVLYIADEVYVHVSDGVVKIKDKTPMGMRRISVTRREHIFLDTLSREVRLINYECSPLSLDQSTSRILGELARAGWGTSPASE